MDRSDLAPGDVRPPQTPAGVTPAETAVVDDIRACLTQLREQADQAERARLEGSPREVGAATAAARGLVDQISIALLAGGTGGTRTAAVLDALGASCAAELALVEGRCDPHMWRTAVQRWERAVFGETQGANVDLSGPRP